MEIVMTKTETRKLRKIVKKIVRAQSYHQMQKINALGLDNSTESILPTLDKNCGKAVAQLYKY